MTIMIGVNIEDDQCGPQCWGCIEINSYEEFIAEKQNGVYDFYLTDLSFDTAEDLVYCYEEWSDFPTVISKRGIRSLPVAWTTDELANDAAERTAAQTFFSSKQEQAMNTTDIKPFEKLSRTEYNSLKAVGVLQQLYPEATGDYKADFLKPFILRCYVHGSHDDDYVTTQLDDAGLDPDSQVYRILSQPAFEHKMEYLADPSTGALRLIAVDGKKVEE